MNKLNRIPIILNSMKNLEIIQLNGNSFEIQIEKQFLSINEANKIRNYLEDIQQGQQIWNQCKILFLCQEVCFSFIYFYLISNY